MAVADPKSPDTAVRVQAGDTLSAIAKANGLTLSEIKALNPQLAADPKYNGGSTIFSNTKINIAPAAAKTPAVTSTGGINDAANAARIAAQEAAAAQAKAAADAAAQAAADAAAKAAADKAAADAAALAAKTQAERDAAAAAQAAAAEAARLAAIAAANANNGVSGVYSNPTNINTSTTQAAPTAAQTAALVKGATELSAADKARLDALEVMKARFKQYGLETLVEKIRQLAIEGASESTITLQLQETPEYQARFKANAVRLKNNLAVLAPAEYLAVEDSYRQTLRAYGLKQFDTDEYVSQFIANDVSPTELSNRVQLAVQRVQNADPAISKTLRDYYGIGQADLVAYTLDPATQFKKIERQVQAAEIGTAARIQGLETGVTVAEQLAAQGVTQAEAQKGYATIADILPTAEKLSAIYGSTLEGYGQSSAEQEVFNTLASAQRARQKLTAREVAQFGGSSGIAKTALSTSGGQI
jgi:LysM repeat protein